MQAAKEKSGKWILYWLYNKRSRLHKIGRTEDQPDERKRVLENQSGCDLEIVVWIETPCAPAFGEWFALNPDAIAWLQELIKGFLTFVKKDGHPVGYKARFHPRWDEYREGYYTNPGENDLSEIILRARPRKNRH